MTALEMLLISNGLALFFLVAALVALKFANQKIDELRKNQPHKNDTLRKNQRD